MRPISSRLLAVSLLAAACSPADGTGMGDDDDDPTPYEFKTPEVIAVAPSQVALGDKVQVIGKNFIDPEHGALRLELVGTYTEDGGKSYPYQGSVPLTFVNPGVAEFEFGPDVFFSPTGDVLGEFTGQVDVVSKLGREDDADGEEKASEALDTRMAVLPSLLVQQLHSVDDPGCASVTPGTIASTNLSLGVRALGLGTATQGRPITFRVHFFAPGVQVQYVRNEWYAQWPLAPTAYVSPPDGNASFEVTVDSGDFMYIDPRTYQTVVRVNPMVTVGQQQYSEVKLARLATGPVEGPGAAHASFFIEAIADDGRIAKRLASIKVWNEGELLPYDGNTKILERYAAQQVSACFSGGDIGRDLTYSEGESESRSRTVNYRWDTNAAASVGLQVGTGFASPIQFGVNASASLSNTFGVDVSESVSSEHHTGQNLSAHILPAFFGACYRQTERIERRVGVVYHSRCGVSAEVGEAVLTDWNWGFDIATGTDCPPPTNLPPAEVF